MACVLSKKLVKEIGFETRLKFILSDVCFDVITSNDEKKDRITFLSNILGAKMKRNEDDVTHIVTDYSKIENLPMHYIHKIKADKIEIVSENWLKSCLQCGVKVSTSKFSICSVTTDRVMDLTLSPIPHNVSEISKHDLSSIVNIEDSDSCKKFVFIFLFLLLN